MTEWDGHDLALLAPEVDQDRSRGLFDRRRTRRRKRRRVGIVVAISVVAMVGWATVMWRDGGGGVSVETGVVDQPIDQDADQPEFEVVDMRGALDPMGTLRAAVDDAELQQLWSTVGYDDAPPDVDFERWVLVTITIPDDACPPTLAGFDRAGATLTPVFADAEACIQPLIPKTFIVKIRRSTVTPSFTLRLPPPNTPSYGYGEQLLSVEVPVVGAPPVPRVDLSSMPCIDQDGAEVCLLPTGTSTELRASGLQPGSTLYFEGYGRPGSYRVGSDGRPEGTMAFLAVTPPASVQLHVQATTDAGTALEGFVSTG